MPRPPLDIDPDWLRERFTMPGATALEIAAEIGHHPSTGRSHARRLGIRMRAPWPDRSDFDEAWLRRRYVDDKAKISEIVAEAGVGRGAVDAAITPYGLTGQGRGVGRPRLDWFGRRPLEGCRRLVASARAVVSRLRHLE